ncbi:hypothetical protein HY041_00280 [Candidatus Roizmanbacteria bacterium]|nr:hypothetical protein [Candidatus Roizmanbacteria bacterium]
MNKKLLAISLALSIAIITLPVFAGDNISITPPGLRRRLINDIRKDKKDLRQDTKELKKDLKGKGIKIIDGIVTTKGSSSITVTKDSKTYTVNVDSNTKFRRHFWGKSSLDEISVNDHVNVWGKFTNDTKTSILAMMIRDISIQKRKGVFIGMISNLRGNTFTLNSEHRGPQAVTLNGSTKCVDRKMQAINCLADLKNDHRIGLKGTWNKTNNTISEVTQVKDYSLPIKPTGMTNK